MPIKLMPYGLAFCKFLTYYKLHTRASEIFADVKPYHVVLLVNSIQHGSKLWIFHKKVIEWMEYCMKAYPEFVDREWKAGFQLINDAHMTKQVMSDFYSTFV